MSTWQSTAMEAIIGLVSPSDQPSSISILLSPNITKNPEFFSLDITLYFTHYHQAVNVKTNIKYVNQMYLKRHTLGPNYGQSKKLRHILTQFFSIYLNG
jgi:hypothetical protein